VEDPRYHCLTDGLTAHHLLTMDHPVDGCHRDGCHLADLTAHQDLKKGCHLEDGDGEIGCLGRDLKDGFLDPQVERGSLED